MILIIVDTSHFTFMATGRNAKQARAALKKGWAFHVEQTGADPAYVNTDEDGNVFELKDGQCWRDDSIIARVV